MSAPESNYAAWVAKADSDFLNNENNLSAERVPGARYAFTPNKQQRNF